MKNVQISQDLFCDLILYHLYNNPSAEEAIRRELFRKLDAMFQHECFTQYRRNRSRTRTGAAALPRKYRDARRLPLVNPFVLRRRQERDTLLFLS